MPRSSRATLLAAVVLCSLAGLSAAQSTVRDENIAEVAAPLDATQCRIGEAIDDLAFTDLDGKAGRLSDYADRKALVIVVRDVGCPVSKRYGLRTAEIEHAYAPRGVAFLFVDFSSQDSIADCRAEAAEYGFQGRYVRDPEGRFGWHLRARTTTDVFVLDQMRKLRFRGPIDDQMGRGVTKSEPANEYLKEALDALLARRNVGAPALTAPGCVLRDFGTRPAPESAAPSAITWHGRVKDIVQRKCQDCHRPGGAAPFPLIGLDQVEGRAAMIQKNVTEFVMPPWFASPESGPFLNDLRLSPDDRLALLQWIQSGCPEGDPASSPPPRTFAEGWRIGTPDLVIDANEEVHVPATGVVDYIRTMSDWVAPQDLWVQAIQVAPRCPEVVHHLACHIFDPESTGMTLMDGYLPGKAPTIYPPGIAKLVRKGSKIGFMTHYTPNGKACGDRERVGLLLAKEPPQFRASGTYVRETRFSIPAGAKDFVIVAERKMDAECDLYRFIPHMHLRGRSQKIELIFPDGHVVVPIEIPRWNPDWQFSYQLLHPIHMPVGTVIRVTCVFDNSADNPFNPAPTKAVHQGPQIWDEMAEAFVEWIPPVRKHPSEPDAADADHADKNEKSEKPEKSGGD